ncbi:hypothetical protein WA026_013590 [Henosepilachna vigintioctopunctata]|uniref:C2H2-type domain-containing protein n=1 Tax=Henosepilachna vigintioctopunctata TaxID=420089 RepID=A0AAW1VDD5_9CUCU
MDTVKVETEEYLEHHVNKEELPSNSELAVLKPKKEYEFHKDECFSYSDQVKTEIEFDNYAENESLSETCKYDPSLINHNQYLNELKQEINEQQECNDALFESEVTSHEQKNNLELCDPTLLEITSGREKFSVNVASVSSVEQDITTQFKRRVKPLNDSAAHIANFPPERNEQDDVQITVDLNALNSPDENCHLRETALIYSTSIKKRRRKCAFCDYIPVDEVDFKNHGILVHNQFVCSKCRFSTPLEFCLKRHVSLEHSDVNGDQSIKQPGKCKFCDFSSSDKDEMSIHMNAFHLKIKQHECPSCDYVIGRLEDLKKHIQYVHRQKKDEKYLKCPSCGYRTNKKSMLKSHVETFHPDVKDRECRICGFRTLLKHELSIHYRTEHSEKETYKCTSCDYTALTERELEFHVNVVHVRLKEHKCHLCDFASTRKRYLIMHVRYVHLKQRQYECSLCQFKTNSKVRLQLHNASVHSKSKNLKCESCGYEMAEKIELDIHVRSCKYKSQNK